MPHLKQTGLAPVVSQAKPQAQIDVADEQLFAVLLAATATGRVDDALHPDAAASDRISMDRRLGIATVVLRVQVNDIGLSVMRTPHSSRAIPAHVHAVAARPIRRNVKRLAGDLALGNGIDRAAAELRNALRAGIALERCNAGKQCFLRRFVEVRRLSPGHERNVLHAGTSSAPKSVDLAGGAHRSPRYAITTADMPFSGVNVAIMMPFGSPGTVDISRIMNSP